MIKIGGLREDMQMGLALKQQINQWLLVVNKKNNNTSSLQPNKNKNSKNTH